MKGLLYKDFCILWKQLKFMLLMVAIFCLVPFGDFVEGFGMGQFFMLYGGLMIPMSIMAYDERSHWNALAAMMPYSTRDLVLSRYCMGWFMAVVAFLLNLISIFFLSHSPRPGVQVSSLLLLLAMLLVAQAIYFPLMFRFGVEKARMSGVIVILLFGIVVGIVAGVGGSVGNLSGLPMLSLPAALVICLLSIKVSMKQYESHAW